VGVSEDGLAQAETKLAKNKNTIRKTINFFTFTSFFCIFLPLLNLRELQNYLKHTPTKAICQVLFRKIRKILLFIYFLNYIKLPFFIFSFFNGKIYLNSFPHSFIFLTMLL